MEIIKIENPIEDMMESSIPEKDLDNYFKNIQEAVEGKNSNALQELDEANILGIIGATGAAIGIIILAIRKYLKNKYSLTIKKILTHSKEINDMYTKVEDLLKHDRMVRFKYRNTPVDVSIYDVVLHDTQDPRKYYDLAVDYLVYNYEYFVNEIHSIMKYIQEKSVDKDADLDKMINSLLELIDKGFQERHWFVERLEPEVRTQDFKGVKMESAIMRTKEAIGPYYNNIYVINKYVANELQYLQIIQQSYNTTSAIYANDKHGKKLVDAVFKKLLDNMTKSIDFNNKVIDSLTIVFNNYYDQIVRLYDILKNA